MCLDSDPKNYLGGSHRNRFVRTAVAEVYKSTRGVDADTNKELSADILSAPTLAMKSDSQVKITNIGMDKYINTLVQTQLSLDTIMNLERPETVEELWAAWTSNRLNRQHSSESHNNSDVKDSIDSDDIDESPFVPSVCVVSSACSYVANSDPVGDDVLKVNGGSVTRVTGGSSILSQDQINKLEQVGRSNGNR